MKIYKYLEMLETEIIKQMEMRERIKKSISGERGNYSKPNYIAKISLK